MGKITFKTVEEAEAHIKLQDDKITSIGAELKKAQTERDDALKIAEDAVNKLNKLEAAQPKKLLAKVGGKSYEVIFGVDGLTKEELSENQGKLKTLIAAGSSAVKLLED